MQTNYTPPQKFQANARVSSFEQQQATWERSVKDPEAFWSEVAQRITWKKPWTNVLEWDFDDPKIRWFDGATCASSCVI